MPRKTKIAAESDSTYFLKMVLYLVLGTQWLWLQQASGRTLPLPIGLVIGLIFAMHDHFRIDRKIEFALLLVAMLFGYVATIGVVVSV
jgi:hypothetical protein